MTTLIAGANSVIDGDNCLIEITTQHKLGEVLGAVWLPINNKQVVTSPAYLHETKAWATLTENAEKTIWKIDLQQIFQQQQAEKVQLIIYSYFDLDVYMPAVEIDNIQLSINNSITYQVQANERHIKAYKLLELYQRNGQYKCRALAEYSTINLQAFSEGLDVSLNAKFPPNSQNQPNNPQRPRVRTGETWTGTAFAIDPYHLLTCEHVIDGASLIGLRQQGKADIQAQVVISDVGSDSALLKVENPLDSYLPLRIVDYDLLGENITTLGFPLTGISNQLQVTQGCIAGLQGIANDIRFLQFTAPIQAGSSGSPVILPTGEVIGMVTASIEKAQNMNFAVKYQLLSALITSSGLNLAEYQKTNHTQSLSTPQLVKQCKPSIWQIGCQA